MNIRYKEEKGFTLIEMIFVVLLLATLLSIISLNLSGIQSGSTNDLAEVDLKVIRAAVCSYYLENNSLPSQISDLAGYLDEIPDDKFLYGTRTTYTLSSTGTTCTVRSVGPDRQSNTTDDLTLNFSP